MMQHGPMVRGSGERCGMGIFPPLVPGACRRAAGMTGRYVPRLMKHLTLNWLFVRMLGSQTNGMDYFLDLVWVVLALGVSLGWHKATNGQKITQIRTKMWWDIFPQKLY